MVDASVRPLIDEFNVDARRLFRRLVAAIGIDAHHASLLRDLLPLGPSPRDCR